MKAGICTIAMSTRPLDEVIEAAARSGAGGVEIWGRVPHLPPADSSADSTADSSADSTARARIGSLLRDAGLEAVALGSYYRPDGTAASGRDVPEEERGDYVLAAARDLRCPLVRIWCGRSEYDETPPSVREAIYDEVRDFADAAGREGCRLVLERHNRTLTASWESAARVIDEIDHPGVSLCYQVPYPMQPHELLARTPDDFTSLLPRCAHAHLQNYVQPASPGSGGESDTHLPRTLLAHGIVDYGVFGREARRLGYEGWAMVEFPASVRGAMSEDEALAADVAFIASL